MSGNARRTGRLLVLALCAIAGSAGSALGQTPADPQQRGEGERRQRGTPARFAGMPRIRAMLIAGGCCHDYPAQAATLMKLFQNDLPIDWTFHYLAWGNNRSAPALYDDPEWYRGYDIIVHNDCFTPPDSLVSERYLSNAAAATRSGVPAVVIHCAMHTFRDEPGDLWRGILGVHSEHHTPVHNIPVKVLAPQHPVMAGIRPGWVTPTDELYILERVLPGTVPLAFGVDGATGREHALVWVHEKGARVFGTTLGHTPETWSDPVFQQLLKQGFRWALGR